MGENLDLQTLEAKRRQILESLAEVGDLRRGSISATYRKCGKANCACAGKGHPGHGPQYLWTATIDGGSRSKTLHPGPALEKMGREVENHRRFKSLVRQLVEVNEQICDLRPLREVPEEKELEDLKKKLRRKYAKRRGKR